MGKRNMEAIIFCGIQATGKSSFFKHYFFNTHIRISLDLLNTRNKEAILLTTCLEMQQRFVVDNTNITSVTRGRYIALAKTYKFKVIGYYFTSTVLEAIARNKLRQGKEFVPERGIWGTNKKLEPPTYAEGFDELYEVQIQQQGFIVTPIPKA